jgi:hypothetical protein
MKQIRFGFIVLLFLTFAVNGIAQQYGILKPTRPGRKSDVIPITKKQLKTLMQQDATSTDGIMKKNEAGILDTLTYGQMNANFAVAVGDTLSSYYDPPAICQIKAVGIIARTWGSEPLAPVYDLIISRSAYPWYFPRQYWDGDGCYTKDSFDYPTLLGEMIWGAFPVSIVDGLRTWTEMIYLGFEPDSYADPFIVSIIPYGIGTMGTDASSYSAIHQNDTPRLAKYYHRSQAGYVPQFIVRDYSCCWLVIVEYLYYPPSPWIEMIGIYGSVLNANPKPVQCHINDFNPEDPNEAGIIFANLFYRVNAGDEKTILMYLVSGDSTDGIWEAVLPAGYMNPGDFLSFRFNATNKAGDIAYQDGGSFRYFVKQSDILFYYNDNSYSLHHAKTFYWNQLPEYRFDTWDGTIDGPTVADLLNQYDYIVRVDGVSPINWDSDVFANWLMAGNAFQPKHLFWSSQEFLGVETRWVDTTYAEDDWHNQYLGIGGVIHDLQYRKTGKSDQPYPLNAVLGDVISGNLAKFCADSNFQLLHHPAYELGGAEWSDGLILGPEAVACFFDTTSQIPMGLHKKSQTTTTVFLAFDQIALDINPPYGTPGYVWPEFGFPDYAEDLSLLEQTLSIFWWRPHPHNSIDNSSNQALHVVYSLEQNYPNPFNNQTKIFYNISSPTHVTLTVHNVLGQKVAQLMDDFQTAGRYSVIWNAEQNSSGVYFCRLEAGNYYKILKILLVK